MKNYAALKELGEIITGNTPKTSDATNYSSNDVPFLKPSDLHENEIWELTSADNYISEHAREQARIVPKGTVLCTCIGIIGKIGITATECAFNQQINAIIPDRNMINTHYLAYAISAKKNYMQGKANAAVVPIINKTQFGELSIRTRSLSEQMEIAEHLKCIEELISNRQKALSTLETIVKSRFIEMFGDPVMNPMGWEVKKLKDLSLKISDGVHAKPNYTEDGKPFISVVNITTGHIDFSNCKFVSQEDYEKMIKSTHPEKGDVLYTKVGATYGIPAYVDTDEDFCLYVSVCLIKPKHELVNARFLTESMRLPYIKHQADRRIRGIGVPDLHLNQIREFDIVCPPLDLQERYMEFVDLVDKSKLAVQQSIDTLQTLKAKLMQDYFG